MCIRDRSPVKPIKEVPKVPMKEMIKLPVIEEETHMELPKISQSKKPKKEEKVIEQTPVAPIYHHYYHHCCPPLYHNCFPEMAGGFIPHQHMQQGHMVPPMPLQPQQMMHPHDCGCHATTPQMQQYQMREQLPFPGMNVEPFGYQTYFGEPPMQQEFKGLPHSIEKPFPIPPAYPSFPESNVRDGNQDQQTNEDK